MTGKGTVKPGHASSMPRISPQFGSADSPARLTNASQRSHSFGMQGAGSLNLPKMRRNESNMSFASGSLSASSEHGAISIPGEFVTVSLH